MQAVKLGEFFFFKTKEIAFSAQIHLNYDKIIFIDVSVGALLLTRSLSAQLTYTIRRHRRRCRSIGFVYKQLFTITADLNRSHA